MGARKKYARRIIGLKLLHIRRCASETRYSAIFKTCFPPHNTEPSTSVRGGEEGTRTSRHRIAPSSAQPAKRSRNFTTSPLFVFPPRGKIFAYRPTRNSRPSPQSSTVEWNRCSDWPARRRFERFSPSSFILSILIARFDALLLVLGNRSKVTNKKKYI